MTAVSSGPASTPAPQLAEGRWIWRRLYVFATTFGLWSLLQVSVAQAPAAAMPGLARDLMHLMALMLVLYLVAPSAQHLVEILATLKLRLATGGRA